MSGIGSLEVTHDVSDGLYWNLWAPESKMCNSDHVSSPLLGDGPEGRKRMKQACTSCPSIRHTDGFFAQGDKAVKLYDAAYYAPATRMLNELGEKGLLKENPWTDEFQVVYHPPVAPRGPQSAAGCHDGRRTTPIGTAFSSCRWPSTNWSRCTSCAWRRARSNSAGRNGAADSACQNAV